MADWSKLQRLDNVDFHDDPRGRSAAARFRLAAADLGAEPARGDPADAVVAGWLVDRVALTACSPYHYLVAVTARPRVALAAAYDRAPLRSQFTVRCGRRELYLSAALMGVKPVPPPGQPWEAAQVTLTGAVGVPGHVPIQRDSANPAYLADWAAAAARPAAGCPFTATPAWHLFQQVVPCDEVTVTCYARANFLGRYLACGGVSDGTPAALPPRFRLPGAERPGHWRVADQRLSAQRDRAGEEFWRIERVLVAVPPVTDTTGQPLAWDPTKCGGTLRWLISE
jgi:hypothetical protein